MARIAIGRAAAELGVTVADADSDSEVEVEVETSVEVGLVTTLVLPVTSLVTLGTAVDKMDVDVDVELSV